MNRDSIRQKALYSLILRAGKRLMSVVMIGALLITSFPALAQAYILRCGKYATWEYLGYGDLRIRGEGLITEPKWQEEDYDNRKITRVILKRDPSVHMRPSYDTSSPSFSFCEGIFKGDA
jgi:hypothetical protein